VSSPWDEVGDGLFRRRYVKLDQNIGAVVTEVGLIVIDSRADYVDADELRTDLARLSGRPIGWLVNTHMHWDHTFGNARFPEAEIVGHRRCREQLIEHGEEMRRRLMEAPDTAARFEEVAITPPHVTFEGALSLHVGGREIRLAHLGRGHTDSDIVIVVDDVCFAGDLVEEGAPPSFGDAHPREWVATLDRLVPMITGPVVPGHGGVVDAGFVRDQRSEIQSAVDAAEQGRPGPYPGAVMETIRRRLAV
jgi:glyoxylase-like metal-dependent hydrolase (beta-lactamase superfamily II)